MSKQNTGRKFFATAATAALVASAIVPVASAAEFTDADKIASWAKEAVEALASNEVISGNPDGSFNPAGTVTRAEAAKMFTVALGLDTEGTEEFADVKDGQWFQEYVVAVVNAGIVNGMSATEFAPNGKLTREQAAKMIVEAYGLEGEADLSEFADAASVAGKWSEGYLSTAVANGIIAGKGDKLAAGESISRQEFAVMLNRAINAEPAVDAAAELAEAVEALETATAALPKEVTTATITDAKAAVKAAKEAITAVEEAAKAAELTEEEAKEVATKVEAAAKAVEATEAAIVKAEETTKESVVESVTALNATQIKIAFSKEVDKASAETIANYAVEGNTITSAELAKDGKSVVITLGTAITTKTSVIVTVNKNAVALASETDAYISYYSNTLVVEDKTAPTLEKVTSATNDATASTVQLTFSEPVSSVTVKINGTKVALSSSDWNASRTVATVSGLTLDAKANHTVEVVNATDDASNVTDTQTLTFAITLDTAAPTLTAVAPHGDGAFLLTFDKALSTTAVADITSALSVKDETLSNLANAVTVSALANDTTKTKYVVTLNETGFYTNAKTRTLTLVIAKDAITDSLGNKFAGTTKTVTLAADTVAPTISDVTVKKNANGTLKSLTVTASEDIASVDASKVTVVNKNGVLVGFNTLIDTTVAPVIKDNTVTFTAQTGVTGEYNFTFAKGFASDKALTANVSAAFSKTLDLGTATSTSTFDLGTVTSSSNVITVNFPHAVKGGSMNGSATVAANYTLNGSALPEGTTITLDSTQQVATITLPEGSIEKSDAAATLVVKNIQTLDNLYTVKTVTKEIAIVDNVAPTLTAAALNSYDVTTSTATFTLTFSEAMNNATVTAAAGELVIKNDSTTAVAMTSATVDAVAGYPKQLKVTVSGITLNTAKTITLTTGDVVNAIKDAAGNELTADTTVTVSK